ncbi:7036_t:CDS:2 [Gigaspora rosea]|nr:7036_t:CDS:2 [Gigaspora rosea]
MDPEATEIDWTNKLNEYKDVFALSTEDFKKFTDASIVCIFRRTIELHNWLDQLRVHKHRIAKRLALTTEQNEAAKEMLIEQECGCQDYGLMEITNKMSNLELEKQSRIQKLEKKIEEKTEHESLPFSTNNNSNPISINMGIVQTSDTVAKKITIQNLDCSKDVPELTKSEGKHNIKTRFTHSYYGTYLQKLLLDELVWKKAGQAMIQNINPYSKRIKVVEKEKDGSNIDTSVNSHEQMATGNQQEEKLKEHKQESSNNKNHSTVTSINKKKGKAKQVNGRTAQGKENNKILAVMSQILTRLNKLEERQETKDRKGAGDFKIDIDKTGLLVHKVHIETSESRNGKKRIVELLETKNFCDAHKFVLAEAVEDT